MSEHGGIGIATEPGDTVLLPAVGAGARAKFRLKALAKENSLPYPNLRATSTSDASVWCSRVAAWARRVRVM